MYGRETERARIDTLLDDARGSRSGALVVRGDPGIGKSALLEDARQRATDLHVLWARGVESESELPFAALHQLLRPALGHVDRLPGPQAAALRSALGLGEAGPHERFLVFGACLSLLSELAEQRATLAIVDDAHWLDTASADALRFVARRLGAEGIVLLLGAREGDVRTFEAPDIPSLVLGGLGPEAAAALLADGAGMDASEAVRDRLLRQTQGNPLALLEVPSALTRAQLAGRMPLPEALPMTTQVERVFLERVRRLPEATQRLLLLAATDDLESVALVARAAPRLGLDPDALDAAEEAGLVAVQGGRLEFRHPLVRSAIVTGAASSERRAAHAALAEAIGADVRHADRRAWHLAAAVLDPDEEVVQALEAAAERAQERGGHAAAARALERAAELSADPAARGRRLVAAARAASLAGSDRQATVLASSALPLLDDPILQAEVARVRAMAERHHGRPAAGIPLMLEIARAVAPLDRGKALELVLHVLMASSDAGSTATALEAYAVARELPLVEDDPAIAFLHRLALGWGAMAAGEMAVGASHLVRVVTSEVADSEPRFGLWAAASALWLGDDAGVRLHTTRSVELARTRGAIATLEESLALKAAIDAFGQRFDEAQMAAEEAIGFARELDAENLAALPLSVLAGVAAIRGDDARTQELAGGVLRLAEAHGLRLRAANATRALALLHLGRGRWAQALEQYLVIHDPATGIRDPYVLLATTPDLVEAAVRAERRDVAEAALPRFAAWAEGARAAWALPRVATCRGLLADGDEPAAHYEEALRLDRGERPFDRARTQLLLGEHLRRQRRRAEARGHLREALAMFEGIRAEPWAERTRTELHATGETARRRDPTTQGQLTPQERQIARLVGEGRSNKEVAAQLYLSPRTIDAHLRNVFGKLEITSRSQLAHLTARADERFALPAEVPA